MKKQTAVEWLAEHYYLEMRVNGEIHIDLLNKLFEQAKEMEREQLAKAELEGSDKAVDALWKMMNNRD